MSAPLTTQIVTYLSTQPIAADVYDMSVGRLIATSSVVLGLVGAVIGGLALVRAGASTRPLVALVAGLTAVVGGTVVVATAEGGLGTGNGLGGGIVAIAVGLIGAVLGGLALSRARAR